MADLCIYSPQSVRDMAAAMQRQLDDRTATFDQLRTSLEAFKFRAHPETYWTLGPRSLRWYYAAPSGWVPAPSPPNALEGPANLRAWLPHAQPTVTPAARSDQPDASAADFLAGLVRATRQAYERGEIDSEAAEAALSNFFLLDQRGRLWAPGVRTGSWYYFQTDRWHSAPAPPRPETLYDTKQPRTELYGNALVQFVTSGANLFPEPVTAPQQPPRGFPEPIRQCRVCGAADVGDQTNCWVCHAPFPVAPVQPIVPPVAAGPQPAQARTCPKCGRPVAAGKKFCKYDGTPVPL